MIWPVAITRKLIKDVNFDSVIINNGNSVIIFFIVMKNKPLINYICTICLKI